jgi:hypothetical protein
MAQASLPRTDNTKFIQGDTQTVDTDKIEKSGIENPDKSQTQNPSEETKFDKMEEDKTKLTQCFPSLALPNTNKEEIKLDLDFDNEEKLEKPTKPK